MSTTHPQNIAIVGAGITGLMSAYKLSKRDHSISLFDPAGFPAHSSASFIAGGMLAPYSEIDLLTPQILEAALNSITVWKDIITELDSDIPFIDQGSLLIAHHDDHHMLERFASHLPTDENGDHWRWLDHHTLHAQEPALPPSLQRAIYLPREAAIHPQRAMQALTDALHAHDQVSLIQDAHDPNALTEQFDLVIDCRGASAMKDIPTLRGVKGEIALVQNLEFSLNHCVRIMHPRYPLYVVPRPDHIFMIGATLIETDDDDRQVSLRSAMELLSALYSLHPSFADATVLDLMAGIRPAYDDNLPRITRETEKLYRVNGTYRHGYLLAPIIASDLTGMIEDEQTSSVFLKEGQHDDQNHTQWRAG